MLHNVLNKLDRAMHIDRWVIAIESYDKAEHSEMPTPDIQFMLTETVSWL